MSILDLINDIPCTYNGIPIQVLSITTTVAPQVKVHTGAFWTFPRAEFLGVGVTRYRINGFLDPTFSAIEIPILQTMMILPTAGLLTLPGGVIFARCLSADFIMDVSNIVEVNAEFIQTNSLLGEINDLFFGGQTSFPTTISGAVSSVSTAVSKEFTSLVS